MNNKNNTAHNAEESNNKSIIYGGIAFVVVLFICIIGYMYWPSDEKKKDDNSSKKDDKVVAETTKDKEANKLIERSFVSEEVFNLINTLNDPEKGENSKQALEQRLPKSTDNNDSTPIDVATQAYEKHKDEIEKAKMAMISMMIEKSSKRIAANELQAIHTELSKDKDKNKDNIAAISEAIKALDNCAKAKSNEDRAKHIQSAVDKLHKITGVETNDAIAKVTVLSQWGANLKGDLTPYSETAIEKALEEWNTKYSKIEDNQAIAEALQPTAGEGK